MLPSFYRQWMMMMMIIHDDDDDDDAGSNNNNNNNNKLLWPISVAARSKAWVYGRSFAGIVGSNPAGGMDFCLC